MIAPVGFLDLLQPNPPVVRLVCPRCRNRINMPAPLLALLEQQGRLMFCGLCCLVPPEPQGMIREGQGCKEPIDADAESPGEPHWPDYSVRPVE